MHRLKKRRPSAAETRRPDISPPVIDASTSIDQVPLKLSDVAIARGDFRGSTIIAGSAAASDGLYELFEC